MIAKSNLDGIWNKVRFLGQAFSGPKLTFWRFYYFEEAFIHKEKVKWEKPLISSKKLKRKYGSSRRKLKSAPQKITPQFRSRQLSLYLSEAFFPLSSDFYFHGTFWRLNSQGQYEDFTYFLNFLDIDLTF